MAMIGSLEADAEAEARAAQPIGVGGGAKGAPRIRHKGVKKMFLADIVSTVESMMKPFIPMTVDAKYDEKYCDTTQLTGKERAQVDKTDFGAPEGSILVVEHGDTGKGIELYQQFPTIG